MRKLGVQFGNFEYYSELQHRTTYERTGLFIEAHFISNSRYSRTR